MFDSPVPGPIGLLWAAWISSSYCISLAQIQVATWAWLAHDMGYWGKHSLTPNLCWIRSGPVGLPVPAGVRLGCYSQKCKLWSIKGPGTSGTFPRLTKYHSDVSVLLWLAMNCSKKLCNSIHICTGGEMNVKRQKWKWNIKECPFEPAQWVLYAVYCNL